MNRRMLAQRSALTVTLLAFTSSVPSGEPAWHGSPILFSPEQFGATDLVPNQRTDEAGHLLETLGARTDRFEPINGLRPDDKFRVLGQSIGRLDILLTDAGGRRGVATCTAALIAPDRIITNYHCVPGIHDEKIEQVQVRFGYLDLGSSTSRAFVVDIAAIEKDKALDFSILAVSGEPKRFGFPPLGLDPLRSAQDNESLFLIHHPGGQPQRLTRAYCLAHPTEPLDGTLIRHRCDTLPGSSGSMIFAQNDFAVVGLHHSGGLSPNDATSFNRGTDARSLRGKSGTLASHVSAVQQPVGDKGPPRRRRLSDEKPNTAKRPPRQVFPDEKPNTAKRPPRRVFPDEKPPNTAKRPPRWVPPDEESDAAKGPPRWLPPEEESDAAKGPPRWLPPEEETAP